MSFRNEKVDDNTEENKENMGPIHSAAIDIIQKPVAHSFAESPLFNNSIFYVGSYHNSHSYFFSPSPLEKLGSAKNEKIKFSM